jgi:uncharacterized protein (TIGR02284 family)
VIPALAGVGRHAPRPTLKEEPMTQTTTSLNELIEVLNDGVKFYDDAAGSTQNPTYRELFQRMASTKRSIASDLKAEVSYQGEKPADGGTVAGTLRQAYTDLRAKLSDNPDAKYIGQLEESEDRILHAFQDALTTSDKAQVRQIAQNYLPDIRRMHDEMRDLKAQLKNAA